MIRDDFISDSLVIANTIEDLRYLEIGFIRAKDVFTRLKENKEQLFAFENTKLVRISSVCVHRIEEKKMAIGAIILNYPLLKFKRRIWALPNQPEEYRFFNIDMYTNIVQYWKAINNLKKLKKISEVMNT